MINLTVGILLVFLVALFVGIAGDYFEINRYVKYTLMVISIILTQKLMRR